MGKVVVDDPWTTEEVRIEPTIGHIAGGPMPGKWNEWVMQQDAVWVDFHNNVYLIEEISGTYAFNILRFLWRQRRIPSDYRENPLIMALYRKLKNSWTPEEMIQKLKKEEDELIAIEPITGRNP